MSKKKSDSEVKLQHSIYRLDSDKLGIDFNKDIVMQILDLFRDEIDDESFVEGKDRSIEGKNKKKAKYCSSVLSSSDLKGKGFDGILLFKEEEQSMEDFKKFIAAIIGKEINIENKKQASSLLILWKGNKFYAITTGFARYTISKYIESHFGLKLMSKYKDVIQVRSRCTNPLHGNIHEEEQKLATAVPISYVVSSNSLLNKITGYMPGNIEILNDLKLTKDRNVQVFARNHIRISPKLSFAQLLDLLDSINDLDDLKDTINMVREEEADVHKILVECIFAHISRNDADDNESVYIYPQNDSNFETNDNWIMSFDNRDCDVSRGSFVEICKKCAEKFFDNTMSPKELEAFLYKASIKFNTDDAKTHIMIDVLNGEIEHEGKLYSLIHGKLYIFSDELKIKISSDLRMRYEGIKSIDANLNFINEIQFNEIESEDDIISKICTQNNAYPLHRIVSLKVKDNVVYNAEFADVFVNCEESVYIVHVKCGFNHRMRDLQKQMELSYHMWNDIRFNKDSELFDALWSGIENSARGEKEEENSYVNMRAKKCSILIEQIGKSRFKELLRKKEKIVFVALIGVGEKFTTFTESGSITAQLCLERLITFFNNENIDICAKTFKYKMKYKKKEKRD